MSSFERSFRKDPSPPPPAYRKNLKRSRYVKDSQINQLNISYF